MSYAFEGFAQYGWQCPICKRVYSPSTPMCWYCGDDVRVTEKGANDDPRKTMDEHIKDLKKVMKWNDIFSLIEQGRKSNEKENVQADAEPSVQGNQAAD